MVYGFNPFQYRLKVKVKLSYLKDAPSHVNGEDDEQHHAFLAFVREGEMSTSRLGHHYRGEKSLIRPICIF